MANLASASCLQSRWGTNLTAPGESGGKRDWILHSLLSQDVQSVRLEQRPNFRLARHPEAVLGKRDYVGLRSGQQGSNLKAKLLARRGSVNGGAGYHGFQDAHPGDLLGGDLQGVAVEDDEVGEFAGFEGAGDVVIM